MLTLHGWITLFGDYNEATDYDSTPDLVVKVQHKIDSLYLNLYHKGKIVDFYYKPIIKIRNGEYYINLVSVTNHMGYDFENIIELCKYIAKVSKNSYGVIYYIDEERHSNFKKLILQNGTLTEYDEDILKY